MPLQELYKLSYFLLTPNYIPALLEHLLLYADELICSITSDHFNLTLTSDGASLTGNTFSAYPILIVTFNKDNFMNAQDPIDWEAEKSDRGEYKGYSC